MQTPSTASLERDAGLPNLRPMRSSIEATLGSSSLGGCPASCPDTYRLTHDHRHVRNWASVEISVLSPLRNIFFRLRGNFPNASFQRSARRALRAREDEQALRFESGEARAARVKLRLWHSAFLGLANQRRRVNGSTRRAALMNATMMTTPMPN